MYTQYYIIYYYNIGDGGRGDGDGASCCGAVWVSPGVFGGALCASGL